MRLIFFIAASLAAFALGCAKEKTPAQEQEGQPQTEAPAGSPSETTAAVFDLAPIPIQQPAPAYPDEARSAGRTGLTHVKVKIDAVGNVLSAQVAQSSGHADLDQAAVDAALKWIFEPAKLQGNPVAAEIVIPFQFALN